MSPDRCSVCEATATHGDKFNPFVLAIVRGTAPHPITGRPEPVVRDGIFDENGKLALLKACPSCGPKVLRFLDKREPDGLPPGQFKTFCREIATRQRLENIRLH